MVKTLFFLASFGCFCGPMSAFDKLPQQYQVTYGNPKASVHVVEYFSLSCLKCLETFRKDFKTMKENYIDSQKVYWVFHLHPADLLTLQSMICLEKLSPAEKRLFWEVVIETLEKPSQGCTIMQTAMEALGYPISQLQDLSYIKTTEGFLSAYKYLKQTDVIRELPTLEINGKIYDEFPHRKFIEKQISSLTNPLANKVSP